MYDVMIIGCGIVGAAAAYELGRYRLRVGVLEAENDVATGTTKANSAILHAGYDPEPGTLMARLNVEGAKLARELCAKLSVPYRQNGSLVLAFSEEELPTLEKLYQRGVANGVEGLALLDGPAVLAMEPNLSPEVAGALYAPTAAIVSPWEYAIALAQTAVRNGVELYLDSRVEKIDAVAGGYEITTGEGVYRTRMILNAAGVHAGAVHGLVAEPSFSVKPNRGEYYLLDKTEGNRVSRVIFQCPTPDGKGVLVSPTVHGNLIVGPNAEDVEIGYVDSREALGNTAAGLDAVAKAARKSVPEVNLRESIRNFAGVRAQGDVDDFVIEPVAGCPGFIDLANIKSPGLTAAPAIARYAVELLREQGLTLEAKPEFIDTRTQVRFKELDDQQRAALIRENPAYGRVICRCETVTEGEILDAIHAPIPPRSVDGVKRRCSAGMGRCQGGFCGPRVVEILARELQLDPTEIMQDTAGTVILTGETKAKGGAR